MFDAFEYREPKHKAFPHVVRFSGGRTSALMTLQLASEGMLRRDRGDVVLFANTTAEHPGTYEFAAQVCGEIESHFKVPCLWYEGCAVESATRTGYTRTRTYKLVTRQPATADDDPRIPGYRSRGEAFEEMVSWSRLPSRWRRMCTTELKVKPGHELAAEWLYGGPGPARQGHHRDKSMAPASVVSGRYNGSLPQTERELRLRVACAEPWARPQQNWQDFTTVDLNRPTSGPRGKVDIWGQYGPAQTFVAHLGLRSDEPERVQTVLWRSLKAEGATGTQCRDNIQPAGEVVYCPLSDAGVTEMDIRKYWSNYKYDLNIPEGAGNCVFCFMKGPSALARLASRINGDHSNTEETPVDIKWWSRLEDTYGRPSERLGGRIGMFHDTDFGAISKMAASQMSEPSTNGSYPNQPETMVPCSCTD